ncbi:MAG: hypothetical protein ACTSWN_08685 [Promethearchaeota archaeon]
MKTRGKRVEFCKEMKKNEDDAVPCDLKERMLIGTFYFSSHRHLIFTALNFFSAIPANESVIAIEEIAIALAS